MTKSRHSDEPTRVGQIVKEFLSGQSGSEISITGGPTARLIVGADVKDDCAVFDFDGPVSIVAGSDYVRGPKFALYELGLLDNFDLGYYLVAANVSDVAAMGAVPIGVLTVIRYPNDLDDDGFREIIAGIHQAATDFGTLNVGGDIGQAERIILSASALGACERGKVLTRKGARPGDLLCITGACGVLGAAVAYFPKKNVNAWSLAPDIEEALVDSWRRPVARVAEGQLLGQLQLASACQDTSDGLKATIQQLADASGVGFQVHEASIEIDPCVEAVAKLINVDPTALAMSASADFQLAFTVSPDQIDRCREEFEIRGLKFDVIGQAMEPQNCEFVLRSGQTVPLPGVAWKHQKVDIADLVADGLSVKTDRERLV